ncbi:MAG: methyltransferase domain-containing protein, partial [Flavobacteriaceae bacterium]|nr:methyltransferase domain-containing protein [Flavobacteriaceae bacterium]
MMFTNHTQYNRHEDLKRLKFIQNEILKLSFTEVRVLDVGCGNGNISKQLGHLGYHVLGIDISNEAIENARLNHKMSHVNFENIAIEDLAIDQKFEVIICSEVLEHLDNPTQVVAALKARLTEQGILIITVPNGFGPREVLMTKPMQWAMKKDSFIWRCILKIKHVLGYSGTTIQSAAPDLSHVQFFTKSTLIDLIKDESFQLKKFSVSNFMETVFPFSFFTKKSYHLQKLDAKLADMLPDFCASGFMTSWQYQYSKKKRILMTIRQGKIGGGETHVLDLVRELDKTVFEPYVISFTDGPMIQELKKNEIPCSVIHTETPFDIRVWKKVKALATQL